MELDQRVHPAVGHGVEPQDRRLHGPRLDRGGKAAEPEPARFPAAGCERSCPAVRGRNTVLPAGRHLARGSDLAAAAHRRAGGPDLPGGTGRHVSAGPGAAQEAGLQLGEHDRGVPDVGVGPAPQHVRGRKWRLLPKRLGGVRSDGPGGQANGEIDARRAGLPAVRDHAGTRRASELRSHHPGVLPEPRPEDAASERPGLRRHAGDHPP